jgi:hypothetical protein
VLPESLLPSATAACARRAIHFNLSTQPPSVLRHELSASVCLTLS